MKKELKGVAWNHTRGFVSVVATAQRFEERNPDVRITWEKRSLQAFADAPLADLAAAYDLIVMDHPHTAQAAHEGVLLAFEDYLPATFLRDQAENSVGRSHESYRFNDRQWTLATDAAAPIATWRQDLMEQRELELPQTWEEVLSLARNGHVVVSLFPVDVLMHLFMFCHALGEPAFQQADTLASSGTLQNAFECLRELAALCPRECLERNPIRTAEFMTCQDTAAYCPFAYGYSNYSRPGYARKPLQAGGLVTFNGQRLRSTLGGAGLAVSSRTQYPEVCMEYAAFTASPETQRGLYFQSGGQPGHRTAWLDKGVNAASADFFRNTLQTLDEALVRPQYCGYMHFQDQAAPVAHSCVAGELTIAQAIVEMNRLYHESRTKKF